MWGRAPLITDAGSWHVHLGTQQMEASSLTPPRERNPSMDFAHTGSLMSSEVILHAHFWHATGRFRASAGERTGHKIVNQGVKPRLVRQVLGTNSKKKGRAGGFGPPTPSLPG